MSLAPAQDEKGSPGNPTMAQGKSKITWQQAPRNTKTHDFKTVQSKHDTSKIGADMQCRGEGGWGAGRGAGVAGGAGALNSWRLCTWSVRAGEHRGVIGACFLLTYADIFWSNRTSDYRLSDYYRIIGFTRTAPGKNTARCLTKYTVPFKDS